MTAETRMLVYPHPDDEEPLHVYATIKDDIVLLDQGADRIAIPFSEFGAFVDALEKLYAS